MISLPKEAIKTLHRKPSALSQIADPFFRLCVFIILGASYVYTTGLISLFIFTVHVIWAASFFRCLGNILHECSHHNFFKQKKHNLLLGQILAATIAVPSFQQYRKCHLKHHTNLGEKNDCDLSQLTKYVNSDALSKKVFIKAIFSSFFVSNYLPKLFDNDKKINLNLLVHISLLLTLLFVGFYNLALLIYVPFFTLFPVFCFFSDYVDHGGLTQSPEKVLRSRNHISNSKVLGYLLFPRYDSYHLIHHLYPILPTQNFANAHKQLKRNSHHYATLQHSLKSTFK